MKGEPEETRDARPDSPLAVPRHQLPPDFAGADVRIPVTSSA
jgi:hypothetical protein